MTETLYFDYAATTPVDPRVAEKMCQCLTMDGCFANPASMTHSLGRQARARVEQARAQVAELVGAKAEEIIWTSGATESNNLAIKGCAHKCANKGKHIITSMTEHKAVLDPCKQLEQEGFSVTYLKPNAQGIVTADALSAALRDDTILVSLMYVNNEIGVIQDIPGIAAVCEKNGILFHVDAAQAAGKIPIDLEKTPVHMLSMCAHKIYGPKGIGVLYLRKRPGFLLEPMIHGGGHERGCRSGTLATHQVVGMGECFAIAAEQMAADHQRLQGFKAKLWAAIQQLGGVTVNGDPQVAVPNILNVCFNDVAGESLLFALSPLSVSSGSACSSAHAEGSHVLRALDLNEQASLSSVRFSFGRFTTEAHIDQAIGLVRKEVPRLRKLACAG